MNVLRSQERIRRGSRDPRLSLAARSELPDRFRSLGSCKHHEPVGRSCQRSTTASNPPDGEPVT